MIKTPNVENYRFKGRIFFLINENTGSTSQLLAQTIKCDSIGTLVGTETGESTIFYGDMCSIRLPNSQLKCNIAYKEFVSSCQADRYHGTIPDFTVEYDYSDILKGKDKIMEFTINLITK